MQSTSGKVIEASDAKKKAGRPAKPENEATRSWTEDEINVLIEAWAEHENFYSITHKSYFNRNIRQNSLISMENTLKDNRIHRSEKLLWGSKTND